MQGHGPLTETLKSRLCEAALAACLPRFPKFARCDGAKLQKLLKKKVLCVLTCKRVIPEVKPAGDTLVFQGSVQQCPEAYHGTHEQTVTFGYHGSPSPGFP